MKEIIKAVQAELDCRVRESLMLNRGVMVTVETIALAPKPPCILESGALRELTAGELATETSSFAQDGAAARELRMAAKLRTTRVRIGAATIQDRNPIPLLVDPNPADPGYTHTLPSDSHTALTIAPPCGSVQAVCEAQVGGLRPPPEHEDKTLHWVQRGDGLRIVWLWGRVAQRWWCHAESSPFVPSDHDLASYRYLGPAEWQGDLTDPASDSRIIRDQAERIRALEAENARLRASLPESPRDPTPPPNPTEASKPSPWAAGRRTVGVGSGR